MCNECICRSSPVPAAAEHRVVVRVVPDAAPEAVRRRGPVPRRRLHYPLQTGVRRLGNCSGIFIF